LPLKSIVNNLKIFPVKNNIPGFIYSALKYFPSKVSLNDLNKTQKIMAEYVNASNYDVVLCEQDKHTMAPFFLKYLEKPHVYFCQQPNLFRYDISRKLYIEAGLEYKNIVDGLYLSLYGSKLIKYDKEYASYSNYMVTNSKFSREIIFKMYGIKAQISYLGVDNLLFKNKDVFKENFVLSVGQCIPEKGFEFIIKSLAKIDVRTRPDFVLVTDHGNEHWKNYLIKLARKLKVKLTILDLITDEELVLLYNQAIMVVYTPYMEPFGLVPLEAMCCGTPVIGVNEGGVMETVLNGKTGILVERDELIFAKEIEELLKNQKRIVNMGRESIKVANSFWTLENSGKRLLNHLDNAIDVYFD
jgi:glycosyltransferase involved in cell wall biosynthesis